MDPAGLGYHAPPQGRNQKERFHVRAGRQVRSAEDASLNATFVEWACCPASSMSRRELRCASARQSAAVPGPFCKKCGFHHHTKRK